MGTIRRGSATLLALASLSLLSSPASSEPSPSCRVEPTRLEMSGGCEVIRRDNHASRPAKSWGRIDCEARERVRRTRGNDPHRGADGRRTSRSFHHSIRLEDSDDYYGERCELGRNEQRYGSGGGDGTFQLYRQAQRRITFFSLRLPSSYPLASDRWQVVMQMKQANPSDLAASGTGYGYSPVLTLEASGGAWRVVNNWDEIWKTPARRHVWTRFAFHVHYSKSPSKGWVKVYADLNGDGDATGAGERSPRIRTQTLKREIDDTGAGDDTDGIRRGEAIPSHLRFGIYHDPAIGCGSGCRLDVDNVQVVKPG